MRRVLGLLTVVVLGGVFFFVIVGVFGFKLAMAGLLVFVLGAVVIYRIAPVEGV
jgi:hypothetical protein